MRKQYLKIGVIAIAVICLFWLHPTFAADTVPTSSSETGWITELLNAILKFLSWGWMLLAFLAGKLMSNDFVYGTFIHLDSALFKLWNYMKNIANFMLGFLFLFGILRSFFTKDAFELKKVLPRYLIAGILIQMSWFIMGAFVDLANIATAAVGAFPQQFIQGSTDKLSKSKMMQMAVTVPVKIDVSFKPNEPMFKSHTGNQTIESMFGKFNDLSGPLMFMGASIFRFQDYDIVNADITSWKNFSIGLFLKLFLLVAFCVPMFVLIVINLIRIFRLWIWIAFAPLAAIAWSFDDKSVPGVVKTAGEKMGFGKLSDVLSLIFQPVAMIGSLALVMILSIGMFYVLGGDPGDQQQNSKFEKTIDQLNLKSEGDTSTLTDLNSGTEINVEGDLFAGVGNFIGGMVGYMIITGFTVVLLWSLIKISSSFSKFTKDTASNIFKWSEKLVANANLIPLGAGKTSLAALQETKNQTMRSLTSGAYANERVSAETKELESKFYKSRLGKTTQSIFGIDKKTNVIDIDPTEKGSIEQATGGTNVALSSIRNAVQDKNITPNSIRFREAVGSLMEKNTGFRTFMLGGAHISETEYNENKANILNPNNAVGQKFLQFLTYAINNDVKEGSSIPETKVHEYLLEHMKTTNIVSSTQMVVPKSEETE